MAANPKETTAIIRENAADHALRPLFMRFEWTRCFTIVKSLIDLDLNKRKSIMSTREPSHDKTNNLIFRPGRTQTDLYNYRRKLEV